MVIVTDELIAQAERNNKNLRLELALALYSSEVFHLRKAAEYAGVAWLLVADEAKKRDIPAWDSITEEEIRLDYETIKSFIRK